MQKSEALCDNLVVEVVRSRAIKYALLKQLLRLCIKADSSVCLSIKEAISFVVFFICLNEANMPFKFFSVGLT